MALTPNSDMYKFSSKNILYVRNLSPLVTEQHIKDLFIQKLSMNPEEISSIEFKLYPGSDQRYSCIEFETSGGLTVATSLNGENLLGLPMAITVINPVGKNANQRSANTPVMNTTSTTTGSTRTFPQTDLLNLALQNHIANAQAVQLASLQARQLAEQKKFQITSCVASLGSLNNTNNITENDVNNINNQSTLGNLCITLGANFDDQLSQIAETAAKGLINNTNETEEPEDVILSRTIHITDLPQNYTAEDVQNHVTLFGAIYNIRVDNSPHRLKKYEKITTRFALVEFTEKAYAEKAIAAGSLVIPDHCPEINQSKTTAITRHPKGVRFDLSILPSIPVAYQQVHRIKIEEKLTRVREVENMVSKKLEKRARLTAEVSS